MIEMETLILQLLIWFYQVFCEFRVNVYPGMFTFIIHDDV